MLVQIILVKLQLACFMPLQLLRNVGTSKGQQMTYGSFRINK